MKKVPLLNGPGKIQLSKFFHNFLWIIRKHQKLPKYNISLKNLKNCTFPGQKTARQS